MNESYSYCWFEIQSNLLSFLLDYKTGFGGQFGVQSDRVDKSALGWEHREQAARHESQARQSDYKAAGFSGGKEADQAGPVGTNYVKTKPDSKCLIK